LRIFLNREKLTFFPGFQSIKNSKFSLEPQAGKTKIFFSGKTKCDIISFPEPLLRIQNFFLDTLPGKQLKIFLCSPAEDTISRILTEKKPKFFPITLSALLRIFSLVPNLKLFPVLDLKILPLLPWQKI